jgi:hypothetical protein
MMGAGVDGGTDTRTGAAGIPLAGARAAGDAAALLDRIPVWRARGRLVEASEGPPTSSVAGIRRLLLAMVVLDSVATYVWVSTGLAIEGNPLVAHVMDGLGDGPGLALRTIWSAGLVVALTALARRRRRVRFAVTFVAVILGLVSLVHLSALVAFWGGVLG